MQPAALNSATRNDRFLEISAPIPFFLEVCEQDKLDNFEQAENRYIKDRTESNFVSYFTLLLFSGEYERLKKALKLYSSDFRTLSYYFLASYLHHEGKNHKASILLEKYLSHYRYAAEGLFLAATLQYDMKSPLAFSMNYAMLALLHFFTGSYEKAALAYKKISSEINLEWIEVLISAATTGFSEELDRKIASCNMPRCAIIALLFMGKKSSALIDLAEMKINIFRYDFLLRDALIVYYLKIQRLSEAERHLALYEKGKAPRGDDFFVRSKFYMMIGKPMCAMKLIEQHRPESILCYIRIVNLLKQIDDTDQCRLRYVIEGLNRYPKSLFLLREYANYLSQRDQKDECIDVLDRILQINPKDQEALLLKATFATSFKEAKQYLNRLESEHPDNPSTLSIGCAVRYEFAEEMSKALSDVKKLRALEMHKDLMTEKLYVDILVYLEYYDEVLKLWDLNEPDFRKVYFFRAIICYLRKNETQIASDMMSSYEKEQALGEHERWVKGEILVCQSKFEEAYHCLHDLNPSVTHLNHKTIKAFFKCLKALNKRDEAKKVYDKIPEACREFYGEFFDWLSNQAKSTTASKPIRKVVEAALPVFQPSSEKKEKRKKEDAYKKLSHQAISLEKGVFSEAQTIGVNPLLRKSPKDEANELAKKCLIEPYPLDFIPSLDDAINSLSVLSASFQEPYPMLAKVEFHLINFLSQLQGHIGAQSIISSRVMNFESIRHSFKSLSDYPHLITSKSLWPFIEDALRLIKALKRSKIGYANISELNTYPIENPSTFEQYDKEKKVKTLISFIKAKLNYLVNCKFTFTDFDEEKESKIIMLQIWYIRAAVRCIYRYDVDKGSEVRALFPEFLKAFKENCFVQPELDGVNFEMAAYIYLSASCRIEALDRIKSV